MLLPFGAVLLLLRSWDSSRRGLIASSLSTTKKNNIPDDKFPDSETAYHIGENIRKKIADKLLQVQEDHGVIVLYACESGSRAWGFPSASSDYDVRFLYVHPPSWYLSIEQKRDVIELPVDDDKIDMSGWDLRKALQLFRKSNPSLLEWLGSPIVYVEAKHRAAQWMRNHAPSTYSPISCMYHYYSMAKGDYRSYFQHDQVRTKKYFYVLRALLGVMWLDENLGIVPTEFQRLVDGTLGDGQLKTAIYKLVEEKRSGDELDEGPRIAVISDFIEEKLALFGQQGFKNKLIQRASVEQLDEIFRATLDETYLTALTKK